MTVSSSPSSPWQTLHALRGAARENVSDQELRQKVRRAGAKFVAQLRAELAAILAGERFGGTSAAHGLRTLDRSVRLDLLQLVFERSDRPSFVLNPALADGDWSEIGKMGLNVDGCRALFAGQEFQKRPFAFQEEGVCRGLITLPSPLTGRMTQSVGSLVAFERPGCPILFYLFWDNEPFLAIVSPYRGEIVGVLLPDRGLLVGVERASKYHKAIATLKAMMIEFSDNVADYLGRKEALKPAFLSAAMNHFGHCILNEYEAVHQLIGNGLAQNVPTNINSGLEYIGFCSVFPELNSQDTFRGEEQEDIFQYILTNGSFIVRPTCGDYHISQGLRTRLLDASSHIDRYDFLSGRWPVVWFEIRTDHRVWLDQVEGIAEIANRLSERYANLTVLIAGWSQPLSGLKDGVDEAMVETHHALATSIGERLSPDVEVVNLVGASTIEKIAAARWTHSFVSGFGTAMIFPLGIGRATGVAHTNSEFLKELNQNDLSSVFEEIAPVVMVDADPKNDVRSAMHYHNWNYTTDWKVLFDQLTSILDDQEESRNSG